ncbi:MAG TPA: TlpA disulfide reductase family protein [Puia sp.]|jgi:thiol-disulfide isomerase/thioredoxin
METNVNSAIYSIKNRILAILFITYLPAIVFSQPYRSTYKVSGNVNVDSGKAVFLPLGSDNNYRYRSSLSSKIVAGHFEISDSIDYPTSYRLRIDVNDTPVYVSEFFMVDSGIQALNYDVNKGRVEPEIVNFSMNELNNDFNIFQKEVNAKRSEYFTFSDSLSSIYSKNIPNDLSVELSNRWNDFNLFRYRQLYSYSQKHIDSYVSLWKIIGQLRFDYSPYLDSAFNSLSLQVKNSHTGKQLGRQLKIARSLSVGSRFPALNVVDTKLKKATLIPPINASKYTLVDFWYSSCGPCLHQFSDLGNLYQMYKSKGFNIIGISTDDTSHIHDWLKVIADKQLKWKQYLDIGGKTIVTDLGIETFPYNFLLDRSGKIIAVNIGPGELKALLEKNS